jgi:hypothetical protein
LQPYKARLLETNDHRLILEIGQPLRNGGYNWSVCSWYLDTVIRTPVDTLYIDAGQDWQVSGVRELLVEIREHTTTVLKEKLL